jgi:hypothetical protein
MATSGTVYGTNRPVSGNTSRYVMKWTLTSQNIAGNYSTISWNCYWEFVANDRQLDNGNIVINGSSRWDNSGRLYNYSGNFSTRNLALASGTTTVAHDADGGKTFNVNGAVTGYNGEVSSGSTNFSLPAIPRGASFSATETNGWSETDDLNLTINNPGDLYIKIRIGTTVSSGSTEWCIRSLGTPQGAVTITPTDGELDVLYAEHPNESSFSVDVEMKTYSNSGYSTQIGDTVSYNAPFTIINADPVFTDFDYKDSNPTTSALTGNDQVFVANQSEMEVTIALADKASPEESSTMSSYAGVIDGSTVIEPFSNVADVVIDHGVVTSQVNLNQAVRAVDSRLFTTTVNKTITVIPYLPPVVNAVANRLNGFEDDVTLEVDGTFSRVTVSAVDKNTIGASAVEYRIREQGGSWSAWVVMTRTLGTGTFNTTDVDLSIDNTTYADFEVRATDELETTTSSFRVAKGKPIFYVDAKRKSVGVGKIPTLDNTLEVDGDIKVDGSIVQEDWHYIGEAGELPFENSWENYGSHSFCAYYKDPLGNVHLKGLVRNGTLGMPVFTLPVGYRPTTRGIFIVMSQSGTGRLNIDDDGSVEPSSPSVSAWVSLDGVYLRAEQ